MTRPVLVVRGGSLPRSSGLGRAHHDLVDRLTEKKVQGFHLEDVVEHELGGSLFTRWRRRRKHHPHLVAKIAEDESPHMYGDSLLKSKNGIMHITDQEQAHLVPKNSSIPVSVTIHDLFHLEPRKIPANSGTVNVGSYSPGLLRRNDLSQIRKGLERADLLICISKATADEARNLWPYKAIEVVPHGIDIAGYDPISYPLPKPADFDYSRINLTFVGSEEPRKRIDFLLDVLNSLPPQIKENVVLHKIGAESNPKSKSEIIRKAKEMGFTLNWVGRLSDIDLCAYYQHSNLLLFPSVAEGFGLPPLEAMASGCPIRVADMPAHNEVAPKDWLLPYDDIDAWVDEIVSISETKGRRQPNEKALKQARKFSIEKWSERLVSAWRIL